MTEIAKKEKGCLIYLNTVYTYNWLLPHNIHAMRIAVTLLHSFFCMFMISIHIQSVHFPKSVIKITFCDNQCIDMDLLCTEMQNYPYVKSVFLMTISIGYSFWSECIMSWLGYTVLRLFETCDLSKPFLFVLYVYI